MKIMLFDETPERSLFLRLTLERLGHEIVAEIADSGQLYDAVRRWSPDAIIIDTESPSRDTLEHLCLITESCPRPIVMFTQDAKRESIREAVRAGVTAYIVDGLAAERIEPIIETAIARFEVFQSVQTELAQTRSKLSERKMVERSKGILMKEKQISEEEAYRLLRRQIDTLEARFSNDFVNQVRSVLRTALLTGNGSSEQVAVLFSIHSRTLHRRLAAFGTSFHALVDESGFEIARQMLQDSSMQVNQIAITLNYSAASAFARAFRRWTGTTPAAWRMKHRTESSNARQ